MKSLLLFCFVQFLLFSAFGQEKRLALVIGNANYDKGALKNPVNDALLMKETLEKLNFEVILDTNLRTRGDLLNSINLFGEKRKNYSVGFVYYAGHGVQIDGNNYILATKEKYDSKINVKDNGVNVDRFLEYFELAKNEINILILDACRNNPFEKNWTTSSRSLEDGLGLAPLSSSGNIIAFSTSAGTTASDGNEKAKNSSYCLSLVKNMMTPDLDLDQIFRNVRKEVREISGGNQLPTVDNHYEGSDFYFRKSTYTDKIIEIDSLIDAKDYDLALEKVSIILAKSPINKQALLRRGRIDYNKRKDYNGFHLYKADSLYPNDPEVYEYLGRYYSTIGEIEKGIKAMNEAIDLDSQDPDLFYWRARFFEDNKEIIKAESDYTQSIVLASTSDRYFNRAQFYKRITNYELAISDYTKAISEDKENPRWYGERANCYIAKEDFTAALKDLDKAIDLAPNDPYYYNNRADFYKVNMKVDDLALKDYAIALSISKDNYETSRALNNRALIFEKQEKFELAIQEYTKAIDNSPKEPLFFSNRAKIYQKLENNDLALKDYTQAIAMDKEKSTWYAQRANYFISIKEITSALKDLDKAIDLAPKDPCYYNNRADFYTYHMKEDDLALKDYAIALGISKDDNETSRAINNRALIFEKQEKFELAIEELTKVIDKSPEEPVYYFNRARIYQKQGKYGQAEDDYTHAISVDKDNPIRYKERANCYIAKEDFTAALKDLEKAIELAPNDPRYYNNRADFYTDYMKEVDLALKDYAMALSISKEDNETSRAINNRALIYEEQEKFDLALEEYTKAIEIYPNEPHYYSNRAWIYQKQQKYELALIDYSQAISVDKENPRWYDERANCYIAKEDFTAALKDLDKAIDLAPNDPYYYNNRADFYKVNMKVDDLALKDYAIALSISKDNYETSRALNNRALIFEKQEKFELAIQEYTKAIDNSPKEPLFFSNRAKIYQKQGKFGQAEDDYTQAIVLDPKNEKWYFNRSLFFSKKEDLKNAIEDISKAIELNPNDADYYYFLGTYFLSVKNRDDALKILKKGLEISPSALDIISEIGDIYLEDGKFDLAIQMYDQVITSDKTDPQSAAYCYDGRGEIYFEQGKYEMALADYTKAIDLEPESYRYASRADVYQMLERPYDALLDYTFAISLDSLLTYLWWGRGKLFSNELNNNEMALKDFEQILKIDPNNPEVYEYLGRYYTTIGEIEKGIKAMNKAIEGYKAIKNFNDSIKKLENNIKDYARAHINLAEIYKCENKKEEASRLFNEGVSYNSEYPESYYWRAWFLALYMSKYDDAISDFSSSIKLEPTNPYWYLNRSKIYQLKGELKKAKTDIDDAVKASKESAIYLAERGNFYSQIGEYEKANNDFQNAFKIDSKHRRLYHYIAEDLIQQGKSDEAIESVRYAVSVFENDTVSFEQLGRIYFAKNEWQKSLSFYSQAASIMEFNEGYRTINPHDIQVFLSDVYLKIAEIYKKLNQSDLECEALNKAKDIIIFETRPDKQKKIKEIQEKLKNCKN